MKKRLSFFSALAVFFCLCYASAFAQPLEGSIGSLPGDSWYSSWLNLNPPRNFNTGDQLNIQLTGNARNVVVRLLPVGVSPDSPVGIVGGIRLVPANGMVTVVLDRTYNNIRQISVHSSTAAWKIQLGANNGNADISSVYLGH
jgi:hypothetical protein